MTRRITLSIALALSVVFVSLMSSDSTANAQQTQRLRADPGLVSLGPGQKLRITVNGRDGNDAINVRFRQIVYTQDTCSGGVCKLTVASQSTTNPIMLAPGEGAFFDVFVDFNSVAVRGVVESNSRDVTVTFQIIDTATGQFVSAVPCCPGTMFWP